MRLHAFGPKRCTGPITSCQKHEFMYENVASTTLTLGSVFWLQLSIDRDIVGVRCGKGSTSGGKRGCNGRPRCSRHAKAPAKKPQCQKNIELTSHNLARLATEAPNLRCALDNMSTFCQQPHFPEVGRIECKTAHCQPTSVRSARLRVVFHAACQPAGAVLASDLLAIC